MKSPERYVATRLSDMKRRVVLVAENRSTLAGFNQTIERMPRILAAIWKIQDLSKQKERLSQFKMLEEMLLKIDPRDLPTEKGTDV